MTRNLVFVQRLVSGFSFLLFVLSGVCLACFDMSLFFVYLPFLAVMLFAVGLRWYLVREQQLSRYYRASLHGWRVMLFDIVAHAVPVLAASSFLVCAGMLLIQILF